MDQESIKRNQDISMPVLPKHLLTKQEYSKYCRESYRYAYEVEGARITMRSYDDYVKAYHKKKYF